MRLDKLALLLPVIFLVFGCGGGGGAPPSLVSIAVTPVTASIALGTTQQFTATGTFSDNSTQNITSAVMWKSSNTGVATISATGLATSFATGQTTVTAMSGNIPSNTSTLTVTDATLRSIAVTPANPIISIGKTQQFAATGTFSNGTTQDLSSLVTWSSSNIAVATIVGTTGLATTVAAGTTTITATAPVAFGSVPGSTTLTVPVPPAGTGAANVLSVTVNGSLCTNYPGLYYPNKPCVSVTVCTPGTSNCQTINGILLDTGSYGLRIFKQALTVPLAQVTVPSGDLAECIQYVDGSSDWGPVQSANVVLGGEPAVMVPIQVIDSTFGTVPTSCGTPETSPSAAGFNGILGVGLFAEDCGPGCVTGANNGVYYACTGSNCSGTTVSLASQVQNPVASLPVDNNGVLVQLPTIPQGGASSDNGQLVLGIDTQTNNTLSGVTTYPASSVNHFGEFITIFSGNPASTAGFIDSGSNALFFSDPALPVSSSGWYIPSSTTTLSAVNEGYTGSPSGTVQFQIGNATRLFGSGNSVFSELGGSMPGVAGFDWGLPFFFGRNIFVGINGKSSKNLGTGPYWAY